MKLYQMVARDISRRKRRLLYATIGVAIGTMTVIGILTVASAAQTRINAQIEKYGPNLSVTPAINNVDMTLGDLSLGTISVGDNYIDETQVPKIRQITDSEIRAALGIQTEGNLATVAPNLFVDTKVNDVSIMVVGIDPSQEQAIKSWWQISQGAYLSGDDQAVVGSEAAALFGLKVGDSIPLNNTTVTVSGILDSTGANDDYQIFASLPAVQQAFDKQGKISSIDIRALCNSCPVDDIANSINKDIPGVRAVAIKQIANSEMGLLQRINSFMYALAGITLAIALFAVVNTILASVNERIKDIGIMRAVGASRNQIIKVFIYEAIVIGIVGGIIGYFAGNAMALAIGPIIFQGTSVSFIPIYLPISLGLATAIAVIATLYPAVRAARIRVADSFRSA